MPPTDESARRFREEATVWRRVAAAMPDARGRAYWERLADDYAKLAAELERLAADHLASTRPAE